VFVVICLNTVESLNLYSDVSRVGSLDHMHRMSVTEPVTLSRDDRHLHDTRPNNGTPHTDDIRINKSVARPPHPLTCGTQTSSLSSAKPSVRRMISNCSQSRDMHIENKHASRSAQRRCSKSFVVFVYFFLWIKASVNDRP